MPEISFIRSGHCTNNCRTIKIGGKLEDLFLETALNLTDKMLLVPYIEHDEADRSS